MTGVDDERVRRELAALIADEEAGSQGRLPAVVPDHTQEILNRDRLSERQRTQLDRLHLTTPEGDDFPADGIAFWLALVMLGVGSGSFTLGEQPVLGVILLLLGVVLMLRRNQLGDQLLLQRQARRGRQLQRLLTLPGVVETVTLRAAADLRARTYAVIARQERDRILAVDAWQDPTLDTQQARLDIDEELARITRRAALIADKRAEVGGRDREMLARPDAQPLRDIHGLLDQALDALGARVAALVRYRLTLQDFDAQRKLLETLNRAQAVDLSELVSQDADDSIAGERVNRLSAEVHDAHLAVTAGIDSLARQAAQVAQP